MTIHGKIITGNIEQDYTTRNIPHEYPHFTIKDMSTTERLQAMEMLWDALVHDTNKVESPGWHLDVLEERRKQIAEGTAEFITLQELKTRHNV